jgi:hypothetical protein
MHSLHCDRHTRTPVAADFGSAGSFLAYQKYRGERGPARNKEIDSYVR